MSELLEQLLYEDEGATLDFKQEQYLFEDATPEEKSELLKDILAFANAWRRSDAFILIGVKEVRGSRSIVRGVSTHLQDNDLQQFVNSKTNRPVRFSYHACNLDGLDIGAIQIPLQERPLFLNRAYGALKANEVYVRRGSSTAIASPDEVARMGASAQHLQFAEPKLLVSFFDLEAHKVIGQRVTIETLNLDLPKRAEIPDYSVYIGALGHLKAPGYDAGYYRQFADYLEISSKTREVDLAVRNPSDVAALDVQLRMEIPDERRFLYILDASQVPNKPMDSLFTFIPNGLVNCEFRSNWISGRWIISGAFGKIQAKATEHTTHGLFLGARHNCQLVMPVRLYADNLSEPICQELDVEIKTTHETLSLDKLVDLAEAARKRGLG